MCQNKLHRIILILYLKYLCSSISSFSSLTGDVNETKIILNFDVYIIGDPIITLINSTEDFDALCIEFEKYNDVTTVFLYPFCVFISTQLRVSREFKVNKG